VADINDLLERTTPRGLLPPDVADLVRHGRRRRQRRRATLLAAPVLVVAVVAALATAAPWETRDDSDTVIAESGTDLLLISIAPDADIIVFVERTITDTELDSLGDDLTGDPRFASVEYHDLEQTAAEVRQLFEDNPEMLERIERDPAPLPASFRIVLAAPEDPGAINALTDELEKEPGVFKAITPSTPGP
jgi:hypothetical protein